MAKNSALATKVLPKIKFHAAGSYGSYGHAGKIGLKVIAKRRDEAEDDDLKPCLFKSYEECKNSPAFKSAKREAALLKKASKLSDLPPKFYEFGAYKMGKKWFAGIFMEHITGRLASEVRDYERQWSIVRRVKSALENVGIHYRDGNENNYIYDKVRRVWRVIDFSPGWVRINRA